MCGDSRSRFSTTAATREDRVRLAEAVHRDLITRGLVQGDEFAPELVAALHVFARGSQVIALVGTAGDTQPVALAAADDRTGVIAVQYGESIEFRLCQPVGGRQCQTQWVTIRDPHRRGRDGWRQRLPAVVSPAVIFVCWRCWKSTSPSPPRNSRCSRGSGR